MSRGLWFVAGAGVGVYALTKTRRAAEALSPEGLRDRLAGLKLGAHMFTDEVRSEMASKENELRERLELGSDEGTHDRQIENRQPLKLTRKGNH